MNPIFICGIDTNVGKTIFSAIITQKLGGTYWKPIQTGDDNDTEKVKNIVSNKNASYLSEIYKFKTPSSPHDASEKENVIIKKSDFVLTEKNPLIIEGAGGIMVPLNYNGLTFLDIMKLWNVETIIVSKNYLGSINHTLLTWTALKNYGIKIKGIVFNGISNLSTEKVIENITGLPILLRIKEEKEITKTTIINYSNILKWT